MFSFFAIDPGVLVPSSNVNSVPPSRSPSHIPDRSQLPSDSRGTEHVLSFVQTKPKRSQVSRACDWCRMHRIKCNNTLPCQNCRVRGIQCSKKEAPQVYTLPQAYREIEKLRQRVKELEAELEKPIATTAAQSEHDHSPSQAHLETSAADVTTNTPVSFPDLITGSSPKSDASKRRVWVGVYASPDKTHKKQLFGPSSLLYFTKSMENFLVTTLKQPERDHLICFNLANKPFSSPFPEITREFVPPTASRQQAGHRGETESPAGHSQARYLTTTQEEYFLGLFWQSYHNSIQIIDEHAFREHYRSLINMPGGSRKPLALVDIIMAICMQYGIAQLPPQEKDDAKPPASRSKSLEQATAISDAVVIGIDDATIAGRWYYYRSQTLLAAEMETPTITTLQCYIFSVIYLSNAAFQTSAHSMLGLASRTAQILGLHLEPDADMPHVDRELRKRIWWTLQTLEIKTCMKLGRPLAMSLRPEVCSLPSDDYQLALLSSSTTSMDESVTWLTYTVQNTKLVLAAHATHVAFFDKCNELLTRHGCSTIYEDQQLLERCADVLQTSLHEPQGLQTWARGVPDALKLKRKDGGEAYSNDCSALEMERFAPAWLQRHRLLLELLYHHLSINLYRPFIFFPSGFYKQMSNFTSTSSSLSGTSPASSSSVVVIANGRATPLAHLNAQSCARHAITLTIMIHEALMNTEHLGGWHEAFQWQWDAAVSLVGFILSDPESEIRHRARQAIDHAIEVFEVFGRHFAMGTAAANVTRDLTATVDRLVESRWQARAGRGSWISNNGDEMTPAVGYGLSSSARTRPEGQSFEETDVLVNETMVNHGSLRLLMEDTMDFTYGLDSFGSMDFSLPETAGFFQV